MGVAGASSSTPTRPYLLTEERGSSNLPRFNFALYLPLLFLYVSSSTKAEENAVVTTNIKDELKRLDEEEARIRAEREKLKEEAKAAALANVNAALQELNALGYNYRLVEGKGSAARTTRSVTAASGTRRTGMRKDVLTAVSAASSGGITTSVLVKKLFGDEATPQDSQSVSNALSALKRRGKINLKDGVYTAV